MYNGLIGNHALDAALLAWLIAQLIKVIVEICKTKKLNFERMVGAGGMPSSHTAFMMALTTSIFKSCGYASPEFAICVCVSLVIMYDATGVRRAAGQQAKILNYMMDHWKELKPAMFSKELKELLGHSPIEVFAGAALGIVTGIVL